MSNKFPRRKLSKADGEYILWHVLEHLRESIRSGATAFGELEAIETCRMLIEKLHQKTAAFKQY